MCGIVAAFELRRSVDTLRPVVLEMARKIRHRGPDWSGNFCAGNAILAHERLAIVDPASGRQPLLSPDGQVALAVNGEIYNHQELRAQLPKPYPFRTQSDCEIILALYESRGTDFLDYLNGIFAFALYDQARNRYVIARDHIGIIPLYLGWDIQGTLFVASELKALEGVCKTIQEFPPGHYLDSAVGSMTRWYHRDWQEFENVRERTSDSQHLRAVLEQSVHRQLMSDVPYGVLLSGGLDSSIISAVGKKIAVKKIEKGDRE
ncbi:MAG TPA: asparagine synthase-related protein, partial [Pirellulaceae bacterium]|nr:asparagine synthase-related protein [Pirellulaceae bacterium]